MKIKFSITCFNLKVKKKKHLSRFLLKFIRPQGKEYHTKKNELGSSSESREKIFKSSKIY